MRAIDRFWFGVAVLLVSSAIPAGAQLQQVAWEDLPARMADRLIPVEQMGISECPKDLGARQPDRRVLQYIENVLYSWEEYDLAPSGLFCIVMQRPQSRVLTATEAQVLLTASSLWTEEQETILESDKAVVDECDDLLRLTPKEWVAPADPSKEASPEGLDRGIVGWASPPGEPKSAVREGEGRSRLKGAPLERGVAKSVIGSKDDRQRVTATRGFPFNSIAFLAIRDSQISSRATGFLVSPYMVLTNGHVVWDRKGGEFVREMKIAPGQTQAAAGRPCERPYGTRDAVRFATNAGWVETQRIDFDYSAAFFETPFSGISTYMPLVFDVAPGRGGIVNVAGFPGEVRKEETLALWHDDDLVEAVQGRVLRHKVDTTPGNSGSPVWELFSQTGQRRAIAVHSSGDALGVANSAARLVSQNFELISEWVAWTPQTSRGLQLTINQVDPADCPAVRAVVSVSNPAGQPVVDLVQSNFKLFENGVEQKVRLSQAEVGNAPVSVSLVLDASGSLSDSDVQNIRVSARAFVDLLGSRDKVAVYHFANGVARVVDYTADKGQAKAAVNLLDNEGGAVGDGTQTALFDAIIESAGHSTTASGRRALVVMTDGQNNTGTSDPQRAVNAALAAGVPVFTIGFGSASSSVLQTIASGTGGRFFFGASSSDLQAILRAIGRTLDNQYILSWLTGFSSGGTERIEVRVSDGINQDQKTTTYSQAGTGCKRPSTCSVQVLSPNDGETWAKGMAQTVRWSTSGPACGSVGIGVFNGSEIWPLADLTPNDGSQRFNIDFLPLGSGYQVLVTDRSTSAWDVSDGSFRITAPATGRISCVANAQTLCLGQGRFQVRVAQGAPPGPSSFGRAISLTRNAGAFWFFDAQTPELAVKVLDGRGLNAHFWVFSGALTNLPYSIFVTDTTTSETRVYTNQPGDFTSFGDVAAFGPPPEENWEVDEEGAVSGPAGALVGVAEGEIPLLGSLKAGQTVLWNQTNNAERVITSSENRVDPGGDPYDTEAADDFVVPSKKAWDVEGIDVGGAYFGNGPRGPADSVNVFFYEDRNGTPGAVQCSYNRLRPSQGLSNGAFELNLPQPCRVQSGRYWVSVQANQNFPNAGQWGWLGRSRQQEKPAVWRNPGNGYNTGCRDFGRLTSCVGGTPPDLVFQLRGRTATPSKPCSPGKSVLCFQGNRFQAELSSFDSRGKPVSARAVAISPKSGYFWIVDANSPELILKVIDGRTVNGSFWVFYGGLTNVDYNLKVTDTSTGKVKTYENRQGRLVSVGDTRAFPAQ